MRPGESEGNPYHFITRHEFEDMIAKNEFIECRKYNTLVNNVPDTWYYGVHKNSIDIKNNSYVVVLDLLGLMEFNKYFKDNVTSFFIDVDEPTRKQRCLNRHDFDEAEWNRRYKDDVEQFPYDVVYQEVSHIVKNYDFEKCIDQITNIIKEVNE
jgi:guanylate kinase